MAKVSLLSLLLCALMAILARGNTDVWSTKCHKGAAIVNNVLTAYCLTPPMGPPWICSQLDLNKCYGYSSRLGIYGQSDGNFGQWCSGCGLEADGHTMICYCKPNTGPGRDPASIDTNTDIFVFNGYLQCFEHWAQNCPNSMEDADALNATISAHAEGANVSLPPVGRRPGLGMNGGGTVRRRGR